MGCFSSAPRRGIKTTGISQFLDADTSQWLADLPDAMHAKLSGVGLVPERHSTVLGPWLEKYMANRTGLKPESKRKLGQTTAKLMKHFPADTPLRSMTPDQAADWRTWLVGSGLSEAAVKTHCGNVKTIFNDAGPRGLVGKSPFEHLKSGTTASQETRYVTPDEIDKVSEACPDHEWKVLFGLATYAGLRVPSETHLLTWPDVDFDRGRLNVPSPKTEHFTGHEQRDVPITPKLMTILQAAFDAAPEKQERLVTIQGKSAVTRKVRAILKRAGVAEWPRLWQTLRSSCEKE